jgi:hypothetical protein
MNLPVSPYMLAGRIISIIGMALTAALAILFFIGEFWWWGLGATLAFFPFVLLIIAVEKYLSTQGMIGPDHFDDPR